MILAIDPSLRTIGGSLLDEHGTLFGAKLVKGAPKEMHEGPDAWKFAAENVRDWVNESLGRRLTSVNVVVFEQPSAYKSDSPKRTLDLQAMIAIDAWICALFPYAFHKRYFPRDWKGNIDADACIERVKARLTSDEIARVILPAKSLAHNVWDSIGIGLKYVGRFEPRKVYAR